MIVQHDFRTMPAVVFSSDLPGTDREKDSFFRTGSENGTQRVMLFPNRQTPSDLPAMTKSPQRSFVKEKVLLGITPVTHDYYNQWARSPKIIDSSASDPGQSTPDINKEQIIQEPRAKTSLPRTGGRMTASRADLKTANPRTVVCRSTTPSVNVELPPMPSLRRSVTVVGAERASSVCVDRDRSQSAFLPKKVIPSYQTLPMSQAVFLFKGDTFIQNAPFLGDPNRSQRAMTRFSTCVSSSSNSSFTSAKSAGRVTLKGEVTARPNNSGSGPVQVAKVQFIDFSDVKSYVSNRREVIKPKKQKEKQFLPLTIPLGIGM